MSDIKRICLWSGPRNISTALMYSFAQRSDTRVFDEPLYAHYLSTTAAHTFHPMAKEVLETMENDGNKVVEMMLSNNEKPVLFFKQMTHHLENISWDFMSHMQHIILTRHPKDMLPSYAKEIPNPTMRDVGYAKSVELLTHLEKRNIPVAVIESASILKNPKEKLTSLCSFLEIPFMEEMLSWKAGPIPEDGVWAKVWYKNVHRSTGFLPYSKSSTPFAERLNPLLEECIPLYQKLLEYSRD